MAIYRTRKQWTKIILERLKTVKDQVIRENQVPEVIRELLNQELISENYDLPCLAVDVWYLFDRKPLYAHKRFVLANVIRDPLARLYFGVAVQAIYDARMRRPCDAQSWIVDQPPGDQTRCTPSVHICESHAKEFIEEIALSLEPILKLPTGFLLKLTTKKNGSRESRSSQILNCTDQ